MSQHTESLAGAGAKLFPAVAVSTAEVVGMSLQDWVLTATLIYTLLMLAKLIWDWLIKPNMRKRDP